MEKNRIIRALRTEDAYLDLSQEERSQLPESPAGVVELDVESVRLASGGRVMVTDSETFPEHLGCCW